MRGDHLRDVLALTRERRSQVLGGRPVASFSLSPREHLVGDRPQQRLRERVLTAIGREGIGADREHLLADEAFEQRAQSLLRQVCERRRRRARETAAEHRHRPDQVALLRLEGVEPRRQQRAQACRDVEVAELAGELEAIARLDQHAAVGQRPDGLDRVQRDALGLGDDPRPRLRGQSSHEPVEQLTDGLVGERLEVDHGRAAAAAGPSVPELGKLRPREGEDEDRVLGRPLEQVVDEVEQALARPLQVLEDHHHRVVLGESLEEHPPAREELLASEARLGDAEQRTEPRDQERAIARTDDPAIEAGVELRDRLLGARLLGDPEPLADHLGQRPVGDPVAVGQAATGVKEEVVCEAVGVVVELPAKPGLADARRPGDSHQARDATVEAGVEEVLDQPQVGVATHEWRLQALLALCAPDAADDARRPPEADRLVLALEHVVAGVLVGDRGRASPVG